MAPVALRKPAQRVGLVRSPPARLLLLAASIVVIAVEACCQLAVAETDPRAIPKFGNWKRNVTQKIYILCTATFTRNVECSDDLIDDLVQGLKVRIVNFMRRRERLQGGEELRRAKVHGSRPDILGRTSKKVLKETAALQPLCSKPRLRIARASKYSIINISCAIAHVFQIMQILVGLRPAIFSCSHHHQIF